MNRHWQRAHAKVRTVWVTVDASSDKEFLAKCKKCRARKKYSAYYNAAAHLCRVHFGPPKRGLKPKGGNKGRSDLPTMGDLMRGGWIKEITESFDNDNVNDNKHDLASSELDCQQVSYRKHHIHLLHFILLFWKMRNLSMN